MQRKVKPRRLVDDDQETKDQDIFAPTPNIDPNTIGEHAKYDVQMMSQSDGDLSVQIDQSDEDDLHRFEQIE